MMLLLPYMSQCMLTVPFVEAPTNDATFWDNTKMMTNYTMGLEDNKYQALETYKVVK